VRESVTLEITGGKEMPDDYHKIAMVLMRADDLMAQASRTESPIHKAHLRDEAVVTLLGELLRQVHYLRTVVQDNQKGT
jgi:hypothetical protein